MLSPTEELLREQAQQRRALRPIGSQRFRPQRVFPDVPSETELDELFARARARPEITPEIAAQEARLRAGEEPRARVLPEGTRVEAGRIVADRPPIFETFEQRRTREQAKEERVFTVKQELVDEQVALFPDFLQERVRSGLGELLQPALLRGPTGELLAGAEAFHEDVIVPLAAMATIGLGAVTTAVAGGETVPQFAQIQALSDRFAQNRANGMALEDAARDAYANSDLPPGVKGVAEIVVDPLNAFVGIGFGSQIARGATSLVQRVGRTEAVRMVRRASREVADLARARVRGVIVDQAGTVRGVPDLSTIRGTDTEIARLKRGARTGPGAAADQEEIAALEQYRQGLVETQLEPDDVARLTELDQQLEEAGTELQVTRETRGQPVPMFGSQERAAFDVERKLALEEGRVVESKVVRIQRAKDKVDSLQDERSRLIGLPPEEPIPAAPAIQAAPTRPGGQVQAGMGIGERPSQGLLLGEFRDEGAKMSLIDQQQEAARNASRAARQSGQADLIVQADEAVAQANAAQFEAAAASTPPLPSRRPRPAPETPEEAAIQHTEAAAPDGAGVPPSEPPTTVAAAGGPPPQKPPISATLKRAIAAQLESEQIPERLLIQHEAAINAAQREARAFVDQGNKRLSDLGVGRRVGRTRAARAEDIPKFDDLYEALHNPSGVAAGRVTVPRGFEAIFDDLRQAMDWESALRIDFDPQMATVDDYFYRGWKVPAGVADSAGRLVSRPGFKKPRIDATYAEMREAGFEPLFWNPYEQLFIARMQGSRYRQQMELVDALKGLGDESIRAHEGGAVPDGWRVPQVGQAFEGKPFAFTDKATGDARTTFSRRWITTDQIANRLENAYGVKPNLSKIHVASKDIDLTRVIDWLAFVPKRAKLVGSLFQHADFLARRGIGSFTRMVDELARGRPVGAVQALANYPEAIAQGVVAMFVPNSRRALLRQLEDTTPLFAGRNVSMKMIADEGLSIRDVTLLPTNIDQIAQEAVEAAGIKGALQTAMRLVSDLERLSREGLFNGVYPAAIITDARKVTGPVMARLYPNASDEQLAALIARAANIKYSVIPASQSTVQNRFIRNFLTRFFFSMGESEALLRQATNVFKGPQKAFWVEHWLGTALYMAATANTIHFFSTGKPLPADRYVLLSKDNFGPLPFGYNRDFMSPDIPFTGRSGTQLTLDLMGQMDTVFRVLDPRSFVESREQVFVRAIQNQVTGTDFFGAPINEVGPWGIVSRTAQLVSDLFAPIGVGQAGLQLARENIPGVEAVVPPGEDRLGTTGTLLQATGVNIRAETNQQFKDRAAVETAAREGWRQTDGSPITGLDSLEPWQRRELERQETYQTELQLRRDTAAIRGSSRTLQEQISDSARRSQRIDILAEEFQSLQRADDADLAAGDLPPERWRQNRQKRLIEWNGRRDEIFQGVDFGELEETPATRFYVQIDQVKAANNGVLDSKAWQELDSWVAEQPIPDQEFISRNTGIGDYTPQEQQYYADIDVITGTGYWDVGDNFTDRFSLPREAAEVWEQFQRAGDQGQRRLRQQFGDLIRDLERARTNLRNALIVENPSLETALLRWEFITAPRTVAGQQFLRDAFPGREGVSPAQTVVPRTRRRTLSGETRTRRRSLVPSEQ